MPRLLHPTRASLSLQPTFPHSQPHAPGLTEVPTAQAHTGTVELNAADMMGFNKTNLSLMLVCPFHSCSFRVVIKALTLGLAA